MLHLDFPTTRRGLLKRSAALGAFMLPQAAALGGAAPRRAKAVIVLLLEGGMSHLETWDPKPNAPAEIRGSFGTIQTANSELIVGEHTPLLAGQAHLFNIIRSVYSPNERRDHSPGLHWVLTGYDNQAAGVALVKENTYPSIGSIVAHQLDGEASGGLPNFVAVPNRTQLGGRVNYNGASHLGPACEAFDAGEIPVTTGGRYTIPTGLTLPADVPLDRLQDRRRLLSSLDDIRRDAEQRTLRASFGGFQQQAFDLLTNQRTEAAFDLNREPSAVRQRYGDSRMGQGTLLARRLVEAGVNFVCVNYSENNSWDTHGDNFKTLQNRLLPPMDRATSALLADLDERGLLDDVLVVQLGEMGRTPVINTNAGRDHWTDVWSILMAGGGLTRGQLLGSTNKAAETPASRPVHLQDVLATIYHQLGIDHDLMLPNPLGREIRILPEAEPVRELIG